MTRRPTATRTVIIAVTVLVSACSSSGDPGGAGGRGEAGRDGAAGAHPVAGGATAGGDGPAAAGAPGGASAGGTAGTAGGASAISGGSSGAAGGGTRGTRDGGADQGRGGDSDAGVAPQPPALPGAVLWLDAGKGVEVAAGKLTRWSDQSAAHNDAVPTSANTAPSPVAARADNGRPAVHFDGKAHPAWLRIADAESLRWGTGDWTVLVAGSYDNALDGTHLDALGTFFSKHAQSSEILFCGNWPITENTEKASLHLGLGEGNPGMESVRKDFNDGKVRVYGARRVAGTMELRVDGRVDSTRSGANGNLDLTGVGLALGSAAGSSGRLLLRGDLQEVIAIKGAVAPAILEAVEKYLMAKYDVSP